MTIDLAMNNLGGILKEATEDKDSVCYVTENDAETLQVAINIMRKYQKIEGIVDAYITDNPREPMYDTEDYMQSIREVIEDGND